MSMPYFQFLGPSSKEEALALRSRHRGEDLQVVAGGTEIMGRLKHHLLGPEYVMSLKNVKELSGTGFEGDKVVVGSGTTLREIIRSEHVQPFEALVEAARTVAAPPIQNLATLGGNILQQTRCLKYNQSELVHKSMPPCFKMGGTVCNVVQASQRCFSVYQGDIAPVLMAFGARLQLDTTGSSRTIPVSEFFTGRGEKPFFFEDNELLTRIILPIPEGVYGSSYKKLRLRSALDYPLASAAAFLSFTSDGIVSTARIVVGAAGSAPKRVEVAEALLVNRRPSEKDVVEAADEAARVAQVVDNLPLTPSYRRSMIGVMTKRAITDTLQETKRIQGR